MTKTFLSAIWKHMTPILSIKDGQCNIANQQEFSDFVENATNLLIEAMSDAYRLLPFDYKEVARSYAEKLFTKENLCTAINPEIPINNVEDANKLRLKFLGKKATPEEAKKYGATAHRAKIKTTDTCPIDYIGNSQFVGDPTCKQVKDSIDGQSLPIVMYPSPLSANITHFSLAKPTSAKYFTDPSTKTNHCEKDGKKAIHYKFLVWNIFPLEYILWTKTFNNYEIWHLFNTCADDKTKYESDLLFDDGARIFMNLPIEVDGSIDNKSITVATVAASHPDATIRFITGENKPFFGFIAGELSKMGFLNFLKYRVSESQSKK